MKTDIKLKLSWNPNSRKEQDMHSIPTLVSLI